MSNELHIADLITGNKGRPGQPSVLMTDAYKFSMAKAGFPLRKEAFYLSHRKGGPLYIPFDLKKVIEAFRPAKPTTKEAGFLAANGYEMSSAMEVALEGDLDIWCLPKGQWALPGQPILTIVGPSFLVSWLESLVIALNFPLQVAARLKENPDATFAACCQDEADIISLTAECMGLEANILPISPNMEELDRRIEAVRVALKGDMHRAFEVGTRAMTCYQQHKKVLERLKAAGITKTANVKAAYDLYMIPVGTTGHEHQKRWMTDLAAFRAIRDMRPEPPSYLPDTYEVMEKGLPAALQAFVEAPDRRGSIRLDSGDQKHQLEFFWTSLQKPTGRPYWDARTPDAFFIFMDGYDDVRTAEMEEFADSLGIPKEDRLYGFGGFFVCASDHNPWVRNRVAAVYKLTQSGGIPVRKFSEKGKESLPGLPVTLRSEDGRSRVAQRGEQVPGFGAAEVILNTHLPEADGISSQTAALIDQVEARIFGKG